jgi:glycogen operon protein
LEFTRFVIELVHQHPVLRRRHFFQGRKIHGVNLKDLYWLRPDGNEMTEEDWRNPSIRFIGLRLAGEAIDEVDERGNRIVDDTLLILLNAHHEPLPFVLPAYQPEMRWELVLDTREAAGRRAHRRLFKGGVNSYLMEARSLALFRLRPLEEVKEE